MNELRPCAPLSLKHVLAQEIVKGLQAVSDSLVGYNATRELRGNESTLFLSLCYAFIEVAYPYCATCFGRCYPNGATLIIECRSMFDGVSQLLTVSPLKGLITSIESAEVKQMTENAGALVVDNGTPANTDQSDTESVQKEIQSSA